MLLILQRGHLYKRVANLASPSAGYSYITSTNINISKQLCAAQICLLYTSD